MVFLESCISSNKFTLLRNYRLLSHKSFFLQTEGHSLEKGTAPAALLGVVWCMHPVVFSVHPEAEGLSIVARTRLEDGHDAYPVALGEDAFHSEAGSVGLDQLPGGIVDGVVRETGHRVHLLWDIDSRMGKIFMVLPKKRQGPYIFVYYFSKPQRNHEIFTPRKLSSMWMLVTGVVSFHS